MELFKAICIQLYGDRIQMEVISMGFAKFMSSGTGRLVRIIAGLALIVAGLFLLNGIIGVILVVVGAIPLIAGVSDVCIIGALFLGTPLRGDEVRSSMQE